MIKPIPQTQFFPQMFQNFVYCSSKDKIDANLLILFHGLGDTMLNFSGFAKNLNLPQTACLTIQAPLEFLDLGFMWYNAFDENGEAIEYDELKLCEMSLIRENLIIFINVLHEKYGWPFDTMFFFGFCQGATVAIDLILNWNKSRFGGCVAVSDSVLEEYMKTHQKTKNLSPPLPLLITHGKNELEIPLKKAKEKFQFICDQLKGEEIEFKVYNKGNEMPKQKDEVYDMMKFFSNYLHKRSPTLEKQTDVVEITGKEKEEIMKQMLANKK
jgi:predicted esterase